MMIVNLLGRRFGFRSYMELATPSTGRFYAEVDRDYFDQVARMMYLTPFVFDDGLQIDFRSPDEDISGIVEDFRQSGRGVDISLVDGWHTYRTAYRDLVQFFDLLNDGGVLVVHDCLPPSREGAAPRFRQGEWWGLSYKAFLDFVLQTPSLDYFTIDCDHGCGVIVKNRSFGSVMGPDAPSDWLPAWPAKNLVTRWRDVTTNDDLAYDLFEAQRSQLLRLVPADRFMALFSNEVIELSRTVTKPTLKQPGKVSKNPRPRLADLLLRLLQRKLTSLTGRNTGTTPSRANSVRRSSPEDRNENHPGQDL